MTNWELQGIKESNHFSLLKRNNELLEILVEKQNRIIELLEKNNYKPGQLSL